MRAEVLKSVDNKLSGLYNSKCIVRYRFLTMKDKNQGWGYVLQWSNDSCMVKAGFTTTPLPSLLSTFLRYNGHDIVVIKAWEATKEDYQLDAERLQPFMDESGWMKTTLGLKRVVRDSLPCDSLKARSMFKRKCGKRVSWASWLKPSDEFVSPFPSCSTRQHQQKGAQSIIRSSGF